MDGPLKFQWDGIKVLAAIRKTRNGAEAMTAVGFSKEDFLVHIRSLSESGLIETELIPYQHVNDGMGMDAWLTPKGLAALQQAEDRSQKTSGSP